MNRFGATGHVFPWQRAAKTIEEFMKDQLGKELDLGRCQFLGYELSRSDVEVDTINLEELRLKAADVQKHKDMHKERLNRCINFFIMNNKNQFKNTKTPKKRSNRY